MTRTIAGREIHGSTQDFEDLDFCALMFKESNLDAWLIELCEMWLERNA